MKRLIALSLFALAASFLLAAASLADPLAEPYLVRDIDLVGNPIGECSPIPECPEQEYFPLGSDPTQLTPVGDRLFFVADDGVHGPQVWVTDGTEVGTRAASGPERGDPVILGSLGGQAFFFDRLRVVVGATDGTPEGTVELVDLSRECHSPFGCFRPAVPSTAVAGGWFYFVWADEPTTGRLFRSDGTAEGTAEVELGDVAAVELVGVGERLFLVGRPLDGGSISGPTALFELAADGSLATRASSCAFVGAIEGLAALDGDLYFYAGCVEQATNGAGTSLYRLDGAGGAIEEVADRVVPWAESPPTPGATPPSVPAVPVGGRLHFARRIDGDDQVWSAAAASLELVAAGLPAPVRSLAAAGERPVFLIDQGPGARALVGAENGQAVLLAGAAIWPLVEGGKDFAYLLVGVGDSFGLLRTDGTAAGTHPVTDPNGVFAFLNSPGSIELAFAGGRLYFAGIDEEHGVELWAVEVEEPSSNHGCVEDDGSLCLAGERFAVSVTWRDPRSGDTGAGVAVGETADSGFFWFFDPANLEVLVKVLDATTVNGHHWVFHGSLTDVEYEVRVADLATGAVRTYHRPAGSLCGGADAAAFPADDGAAGAAGAPLRTASGGASAALTLGPGGRFTVAVEWLDPETGTYRPATLVEKTADSAWAWFFDPANVEVFLKVLDARVLDGRFWVFHGGLTDVAYRVTITDGATGAEQVYEKPAGSLCGGADTAAF